METLLENYWPHMIAVITLIVWLVRLEAKVSYNQQALQIVDEHKEQLLAVKEHLVEIKTDLKWVKESVGSQRRTVVNQNN